MASSGEDTSCRSVESRRKYGRALNAPPRCSASPVRTTLAMLSTLVSTAILPWLGPLWLSSLQSSTASLTKASTATKLSAGCPSLPRQCEIESSTRMRKKRSCISSPLSTPACCRVCTYAACLSGCVATRAQSSSSCATCSRSPGGSPWFLGASLPPLGAAAPSFFAPPALGVTCRACSRSLASASGAPLRCDILTSTSKTLARSCAPTTWSSTMHTRTRCTANSVAAA
mmetsp:Transcript_31855/g.101478  ORF Transcript_31855/g.101478 Transcript_31855/m.101478 type:complete len:229 (-) Transcript_31855:2246-2932(-)